MQPYYRFSSVAKINRFLHINRRREDGYHELQSVFQMLDFGDYLQFQITNNNDIQLLTPINGVANEDNLIVKAAYALKPYADNPLGVNIKLEKRLPMGGGLGGGSSNAATVLLALNTLWDINLSTDELAKIGLALGADVPVFVHGYTAFAEGVGEKLTPVTIDNPWFLITVPDVHISTAEIFSHPDLPRNTPILAAEAIDIEQSGNDCEQLVIKLYPEVAKLMAWLLEYAPSRLTGTGACIFSWFNNKESAEAIQQKLPPGTQSFIAKGLDKSPILQELQDCTASTIKSR
ncbi:4-(cytidine 5'-diphospho)-2-C-methyl-D-erythritol kinase [Thalassotalea maritima]|uniref:4-(cytidine 5'-diphospho)-2-C-methyl-D-erythritol kinase n=1 Tax=Thalassotalea maritima TaxID=3242416 RepID=UPI0035285C07